MDPIYSDDPFADLPMVLKAGVKRTYSRRDQTASMCENYGLETPPPSSSPPASPVLRSIDTAKLQATSNHRRSDSTAQDPVRRSSSSLFGTKPRSLPSVSSSKNKMAKANRSACQKAASTTKAKPFVQMHLNLLPAHVTCKDCGMSYTRTSPDDVALHSNFHTTHLQGLAIPASIMHDGSEVLRISYLKQCEMNLINKSLEIVDAELSATSPPLNSTYNLHALVRNNRIISFVLSHPLDVAYPVTDSGELMKTPTKTILGISRMWTCKTHRGKGLVRKLLDQVLALSVTGYRVKKSEVGFTQLSGTGGIVAKKWLQDCPVLVYSD